MRQRRLLKTSSFDLLRERTVGREECYLRCSETSSCRSFSYRYKIIKSICIRNLLFFLQILSVDSYLHFHLLFFPFTLYFQPVFYAHFLHFFKSNTSCPFKLLLDFLVYFLFLLTASFNRLTLVLFSYKESTYLAVICIGSSSPPFPSPPSFFF